MPENTVYVGRPSRWGNPFTVESVMDAGYATSPEFARVIVTKAFTDWVNGDTWAAGSGPEWEQRLEQYLRDMQQLKGKNLACWCPLDQPCHADVLLKIANQEPS